MIIEIDGNVILTGTLAKDAEEKSFNKGDRTFTTYSCSVAVDKIKQVDGELKTVWANCFSWNSALGKLTKGEKVFMVGKREIQTYINREGIETSTEKINVDFVLSQGKSNYASKGNQESGSAYGFKQMPIKEEDLPF